MGRDSNYLFETEKTYSSSELSRERYVCSLFMREQYIHSILCNKVIHRDLLCNMHLDEDLTYAEDKESMFRLILNRELERITYVQILLVG